MNRKVVHLRVKVEGSQRLPYIIGTRHWLPSEVLKPNH